jgi:hypothetical protein
MNAVALVVEGAGEQTRGGGLADAPHAREHEGMSDAPGRKGVLQRPDHGLLPDQILEGLGTILASQDLVRCLVQRAFVSPRRRRREHVACRNVTLG